MEAENDKVVEKDYLDLLDITTKAGEEEDNQLFQWPYTFSLPRLNCIVGDAQLLVGLVSSYRHDRELVDFNLAKSEVAKLHEAIEKKQLDHDDVVWILTTRNFFQLKATFAINSSGNGDLGSILRGVILCIVSPEKHFVEVIRASTIGYWTKDEDSLTRAIIKGEYFKMNNTNLDNVVRRDASGVYKSFLMALIGAKI
ncbi:hypothetical protein AAG906_031354 [Vitis piasezkii]